MSTGPVAEACGWPLGGLGDAAGAEGHDHGDRAFGKNRLCAQRQRAGQRPGCGQAQRGAAARGIRAVIAGAGGAAHLPGMVASATPLPVIGVPVPLATLDGMDSLLSIVQMPAGVPVATVSIGGARNAGLLAVRILAASDPKLRARMESFQEDLEALVLEKDRALREQLLGE